MAYRIDYQPVKKLRGVQKRRSSRAAMTGSFFLLFLLGAGIFWPEGRAMLQGLLFSGDTAVTAAAMEDFVRELGEGTSVKEALFMFFRQIMEGRCLAPD